MLSDLEFAKLVSRTASHQLNPLLVEKYSQIEDPSVFWRCVKDTLPKTLRYLHPNHPINTNISILSRLGEYPVSVYDVFFHQPNPIVVPFLMCSLPSNQKVSIDLLAPVLEQYNQSEDFVSWQNNMLWAGRLSLQHRWGKSFNPDNACISLEGLADMWCQTYTHLSVDNLFKRPDRRTQFADALPRVFSVVEQRFPEHLGKLMNTALDDMLSALRGWVVQSYMETWMPLWEQLSAQHWVDVDIPQNPYIENTLNPLMSAVRQKEKIMQEVATLDSTDNAAQTKRKI